MRYKISWQMKLKKGLQIPVTSDWLEGNMAELVGEQLAQSGQALNIVFFDEMGQSWTWKEMKKLNKKVIEEPQDIVVYFDGGFQADKWVAGVGVVIYYKIGEESFRFRGNEVFSELESNNEAEYAALYFAIHCLEELGVKHVPCMIKGDSLVVLKQLEGEWPCFEENLNRWLDRIEEKMEKLKIKPKYIYISRKENKEADRLAAQSLEGVHVRSVMKI